MAAVGMLGAGGGVGVADDGGTPIPFIDDSGSSCASSMMDDDRDSEDAASLSHLLEDAASREFSINGLHEDLASLSCGYASLDAHSLDGRSEEGGIKEGRDRKECWKGGGNTGSSGRDSGKSGSGSCDSHKRSSCEVEYLDIPEAKSSGGSCRSSIISQRSSPRSRRTSKSSIKSTDALDDDLIDNPDLPPPSLPPALPPCETCTERQSSTCSSVTTSTSAISCATCGGETDVRPETEAQEEEEEEEEVVEGKERPSSSPQSPNPEEVTNPVDKDPVGHEDVPDGGKLKTSEDGLPEEELKNNADPSVGKDGDNHSTELGDPCGRVTPNHYDTVEKEVWSPGAEPPVPLGASTPAPSASSTVTTSSGGGGEGEGEGADNSCGGGSLGPSSSSSSSLKEGKYAAPHHYISSMRVASMRGAADMGGALVARVASFLRGQYKVMVTHSLALPWCQGYRMMVSDFETTLVHVPLASHLKAPPGFIPISAILQPYQVSFNESTMEDHPKRVLIEGDPGYGRSTLALKLAYDWAMDPAGSYLSNYSLVFVITLRDFRGGSLYSHLCKEVLPRHILSKEAMNTLWNHLKKIEEKVVFLLVGYDELNDEEAGDIKELIDGVLLPNATVVITSRPGCTKPLPQNLHRRLLITGLKHEQTLKLISSCFTSLNKPDNAQEVISLISANPHKYGDLVTCPIMCLALGVLYEDLGGKLPSRLTDVFMSLIKHMIRKNLIKRGEPMCYDVLPDKYNRLLQDFGKLSLESLKNNAPYFTLQDLKTGCHHGLEIVDLGILLRMVSMSKLSKKDHYTPAHKSFLEFLAAFYLSGLIHDTSLLQLEIDSITEKMDIMSSNLRQNSGLMILRYLMGLLGRNAHLVFNIVSQFGLPQRILFFLLKESGMYQMNVMEVCKHVSGREHVVIQTNYSELEDWGQLLYSPDCTLEGVEVILDFDGSAKDRQESFFTSLSFNESVKSVKLTCVVGGDFGEAEVTRLVSYVRAVLTKRRLESFEVQVTAIEDSTGEILSPVVEMICDTLPDLALSLNKLVVALELEGEQVVRLCEVLQEAPHVRVLHLPHLACGVDGLRAVANLVGSNPLLSLNLTGSLSSGTPVDERSTGAGTPSPTREEPIAPLNFWNFTDAQGNTRSVFNSLPRSFYQSLPRRGRLNSLSAEKRNSDTTLLQKTSFPPPTCCPLAHTNGFHEVFSAFRHPECRVCHLNISKCTLGAEDLVCLGETVRFTKCLSSLRMEGLSRMAEIIPVLIALQENTTLQLLDLTSPHILLGDAAFHVTLNALAKNRSLRFLVLNGWTLQLESERSLREFISFLATTELQHLDLGNTRVMVSLHEGAALGRLSRQDDIVSALQEAVPPLTNNSLAFLNLDNFEVTLNNKVVLRGPQLFFLLRHLPKLVDVSLTSNLGSDVIDDATSHRLFALIPTAFPCLRRLTIGGWVFSLDNCEKVMRAGGKQLRSSQLREVHLGGVEVRESSGKPEMEHTLLQAFTSNLHHLSTLSLVGLKLTPLQGTIFGKSVRDKLSSSSLELETRGLSYSVIKAFRHALVDGGKYELNFLGGSSVTYHIKKVDRREKMLGKWACISTLDRLTEL
ncbi:uncharacterized protein LOC143021810 isoform X2 [Oratosquilla oratoria]